jgi:hypothetical protein
MSAWTYRQTDGIRVAGCATPTGSAGHAGVTASSQLTFHLDHSMQAGHMLRLGD